LRWGQARAHRAMDPPGSSDTLQAAASSWEELLELRRRPWSSPAAGAGAGAGPRGRSPPSAWGSAWEEEETLPRKAPRRAKGFAAELRLGLAEGALRVEDGLALAACAAPLRAALLEEGAAQAEDALPGPGGPGLGLGPSVRVVDLSGKGLTLRALRAAVHCALAEASTLGAGAGGRGGTGGPDVALKSPGVPGRSSLGARTDEAQAVEDAVYALEVLEAASFLQLPMLERAAEARLLREGGLSASTAMPLFARSFGKRRAISARCLQLLAERGPGGVLQGRERQLGVLFATHATAASVLCGTFNGLRRSKQFERSGLALDPVLAELLLGPSAVAGPPT